MVHKSLVLYCINGKDNTENSHGSFKMEAWKFIIQNRMENTRLKEEKST